MVCSLPPVHLTPTLMSRYGSAIAERRETLGMPHGVDLARETERLEQEHPDLFMRSSQSTISRIENDRTGDAIEGLHGKRARTISYALKWTSAEFERHVGVPIGPVPLIEEIRETDFHSFLEKYADTANLSIRIPVLGSVAAGDLKGDPDEATEYRRYSPDELPRDITDPRKLRLLRVNGNSMFEENLPRPVPDGSMILVELDAAPTDGQLVIAFIPELGTLVLKQYREEPEAVLLRSYRVGGPAFWSTDYPGMSIRGVVRRVTYEA